MSRVVNKILVDDVKQKVLSAFHVVLLDLELYLVAKLADVLCSSC